jgi:DNA-binding NtrC family response regulator
MHKILLVDDDKNILELNRLILEAEGYFVDDSDNAETALKYVSSGSYDVVVLDYFMPDMNGDELVEKIMGVDECVKFVLVTGYSHFKASLELVVGNRGKVLIKPVEVSELLDTLTELVNNQLDRQYAPLIS